MNYEEVNRSYVKQLKYDSNTSVDYNLFNLTKNFTLNDWRKVRTDEYWLTIHGMNSFQKKKELLERVRKYLKLNTK